MCLYMTWPLDLLRFLTALRAQKPDLGRSPAVVVQSLRNICFFAGWEVRIVKNWDRGLENAVRGRRLRAAFSSARSQFFTARTDLKPVNNLFIFSKLSNEKKKKLTEKNSHASITVTVVRDRKIGTALRTNQIVGFVTVPAWGCIKRQRRIEMNT